MFRKKRIMPAKSLPVDLKDLDISKSEIGIIDFELHKNELLSIERQSFEFAWPEEEFVGCLAQSNIIGRTIECNSMILGYMIYELHKSGLRIVNFAVHPGIRRRKVGTKMVRSLIDKLAKNRRNQIVLEVRETNVPAQLFFGNCGFRAISVLRNHFEDTNEDAYYMRYALWEKATELFVS